MPQTPHPDFVEDVSMEELDLKDLFILKFDPDTSSTWQYYAAAVESIVFGGETYLPAPIKRGNITGRKDSPLTQNDINIGDPLGIIWSLWKQNIATVEDMLVRVQTVSNDSLAQSTALLEVEYGVKTAGHSGEWTTFKVGGAVIFEDTLPRGIYTLATCNHYAQEGFKSARCGYVGGLTCDGTLARCIELGNRANCGCYPQLQPGF